MDQQTNPPKNNQKNLYKNPSWLSCHRQLERAARERKRQWQFKALLALLGKSSGVLKGETILESFPAVTELIEHVSQVKRTRLRNHSDTGFHFNICPQGLQILFSRSQRGHATALEIHVLFLAAFQIHSLSVGHMSAKHSGLIVPSDVLKPLLFVLL